MKKFDAALDWVMVLSLPIGVMLFWSTDNIPLLRFAAIYWLISVAVRSALAILFRQPARAC